MKPARILFTVSNDLTYDQRMQRICGSLAQAGFEVSIAGRILPESQPLGPCTYRRCRLNCVFRKGPLFYAALNLRLFFWLLFRRADIISAVDLDTLPAAWLAARLRRLPCMYDAHEYFPEVPELQGRPRVRKFWRTLEAFLVPRVTAAYTVSDSIAGELGARYGVTFHCIRNLPEYREGEAAPRTPHYIIYQGALNAGRGLEELLAVMGQTGLQLWLAGEGDLSLPLRELAARQAPGQVRFLGRLAPESLPEVTEGALFGVNLLRPAGMSYRYSLSNKFFDYIMAGIPQLCTGFDEYRRINDQYEVALLLDDLEPGTLLGAIDRLQSDGELRRRLVENCRKARKELNWQRESKKLIALYESLT